MPQISAKLLILDDSSNVSYAGNSSNSIWVWGAQLELEQNFEETSQNYHNFRYIRTTGAIASALSSRYGLDANRDSAPVTDALRWVLGFNLGRFADGSVKDATDINTVYNQGFLRMTSYVDIDYIAEDYVGESRVLTY